jgi:hypothetical protein
MFSSHGHIDGPTVNFDPCDPTAIDSHWLKNVSFYSLVGVLLANGDQYSLELWSISFDLVMLLDIN